MTPDGSELNLSSDAYGDFCWQILSGQEGLDLSPSRRFDNWLSTVPLFSAWNTQYYRLFGPTYPAEGTPVSRQVVKSAFELPWPAQFQTGRTHLLGGRSWSGNGRIGRVEVSTDGGHTWTRASFVGGSADAGWRRWRVAWRPTATGSHTLKARATDVTESGQPDQTPYNTLGYLFDAVVDHPVTVVSSASRHNRAQSSKKLSRAA